MGVRVVKVGDVIKLQPGTVKHWNLETDVAMLLEKLPRSDNLEYDWLVMADGRFMELGRQIEQSTEVISKANKAQ